VLGFYDRILLIKVLARPFGETRLKDKIMGLYSSLKGVDGQ
jgi:hypothetical protein